MSYLSSRVLSPASPNEAALLLEAHALQAGSAWGCQYSSSAEYDAALIAERRAAGIYGPKRQRRQLLTAACAVAAGLAVIIAVIQLL
ncbi:hypothetical protein [Pseudolabrys sp. FHR47]|uniref:hypothetical protein n=1 Tax=Pseudolabrys sp. FHR47 TaxID=2562284 RepID=UPI0010BE4C6F|nr:hypothetical protein [Pseudolabrys sp. FHR47]